MRNKYLRDRAMRRSGRRDYRNPYGSRGGYVRDRADMESDMARGRRYGRDYAEEDMDKEYEEKLHEWIKKLKKKDRFSTSKDDIIRKAVSMDVKFDKFSEDEFYATYLMMVSDFKHVANDPHHYLAMAKEWLMDDDVELTGSDKVCAYLYTIVLGETE